MAKEEDMHLTADDLKVLATSIRPENGILTLPSGHIISQYPLMQHYVIINGELKRID